VKEWRKRESRKICCTFVGFLENTKNTRTKTNMPNAEIRFFGLSIATSTMMNAMKNNIVPMTKHQYRLQ
jgi:hypothetical protein